MSDSDNDSMNGSMDESFDMGEQSSTAIVLAGMELTPGAEPQPLTPAGELPASAVVSLTRATLVMKKPIANNTVLYLRSHVNEEQIIVLTVLSNAHPTSALDLCFHADSVPEFSVEAVGGAAADVSVHISGYVEVSGDNEDEDDEEDDEAMERMLQGLKDEEDDEEDEEEEEQVNNKKRKAADEEIDSDEADEPAQKPAKAQKTAEPKKAPSQKQAATPAAPQTIKLPSGLQITDEVVGTGTEAKFGQTVQIRYKGELMNGKVFDTNMPRGKPFSFKLGAGECIPGFDGGIKGMKVGGRRVVVIPSALGYGKRGSPPTIPANATLKFTIELLKC